MQACVGWSLGLTPQVVSSMNMRSMIRGGSGEASDRDRSGDSTDDPGSSKEGSQSTGSPDAAG